MGARMDTIGRNKTGVLAEDILDINFGCEGPYLKRISILMC